MTRQINRNNNHSTECYEETIRELTEMGIDIIQPIHAKEKEMAEALDMFSTFVLEEEPTKCQTILETHLGKSVGVLQGGNEENEIYRVLITSDDNEATSELLQEFHLCYNGFQHILSKEKLQLYMLQMCAKYGTQTLENVMFIMAFGPVTGQVRHIDNMVTNVQICLYMSKNCPSTIIYSLDGPTITNVDDLLYNWRSKYTEVPDLIETVLKDKRDMPLKIKWYTKFCKSWNTIDSHLECFGKLYQNVLKPLSITVDPGTTLVAGGNDVHAGPPTNAPRMFAFAIGISDDSEEDNNGEVQYSPVLFHLDFCCILFAIMDFEYQDREKEHTQSKLFLLQLLVAFVREFPLEPFDRLLSDERTEVRDWLVQLVVLLNDKQNVDVALQKGVASESIFYSPDVVKRRSKRKKKGSFKPT